MQKKILTGIGIFVMFAFLSTSCNVKLPTFDTQTNNNADKNQNVVNSGNQQTTGNTDGNLDGKASDSDPVPAATPVPVSSSEVTVSPTPSPAASSAIISGKSGQLNIIINPNPPVQR